MSIALMTLVWKCPFPTSTQMLIALKLADHASDDGTDVFPGKGSLAERARCSVSTIKTTLKLLREAGLLIVVREGGKSGPHDTTEYRFNVGLLNAIADGSVAISGCSSTLDLAHAEGAENTGPNFDPLHFDRVAHRPGPGQPAGATRSAHNPQIIKKHQEPSGARSREENSDLEVKAHRPVLAVQSGDAAWSAWMEHLKRLGRDDLVEAARDAGTLSASSRWPKGDELPKVRRTAKARNVTGEAV